MVFVGFVSVVMLHCLGAGCVFHSVLPGVKWTVCVYYSHLSIPGTVPVFKLLKLTLQAASHLRSFSCLPKATAVWALLRAVIMRPSYSSAWHLDPGLGGAWGEHLRSVPCRANWLCKVVGRRQLVGLEWLMGQRLVPRNQELITVMSWLEILKKDLVWLSLEQRGLGTGWDLMGKQLKPLIQTIRKARVLQSSLLLLRGRAKKIKAQYIDSTSPSSLLGGSSWTTAYPDIPTWGCWSGGCGIYGTRSLAAESTLAGAGSESCKFTLSAPSAARVPLRCGCLAS